MALLHLYVLNITPSTFCFERACDLIFAQFSTSKNKKIDHTLKPHNIYYKEATHIIKVMQHVSGCLATKDMRLLEGIGVSAYIIACDTIAVPPETVIQ